RDLARRVARTDTGTLTGAAGPCGKGTMTRPRLAAEPFRCHVHLAVMGTVDTTFSSSSRDSHMTLGWDNPTADPTTTVLLRHGDTRLSPEHRFSGLRDLPLSAIGTRQAQAAACRLATGAPVDAAG